MQQIKNIIFDLGGIFININYKKTEDAFIAAGITNFNNLYNQHHATTLFEELETGKITPSNFYHQFRQISNSQISDTTIQTCWNAMLGDFLMKEIQWLQSIQHKYQMYLFSNTNQIHYNAFTYLFTQQTKQLSINQYFKKSLLFSHFWLSQTLCTILSKNFKRATIGCLRNFIY